MICVCVYVRESQTVPLETQSIDDQSDTVTVELNPTCVILDPCVPKIEISGLPLIGTGEEHSQTNWTSSVPSKWNVDVLIASLQQA